METPERVAYVFLADGESEEEHLTFGELDRRSRAVAARLQELGLGGERVLLLLPPGLEYVAAFLGCLYAGAIAVPAYPPTGSRGLPRLLAIVDDCRPRGVLTVAAFRPTLEGVLAQVPKFAGLPLLAVGEADAADAEAWREPDLGADSLAFLQYTSGSTSRPKGVMVSHGNLLANEGMIQEAFGTVEGSVIVSWLPLYHDMGLIGGLLHPLYLGARCILFSPIHFLQRPVRWLQAICRYRASVSGGPNFAYDLSARRVSPEEMAGLDLATWQVAFNGAEPVRSATLERFAATFAGAGFDRRAFFPCYGLAEATLLVSGSRRHREVQVFAADPAALAENRLSEVPPAEEGTAQQLVSSGRVPAGLDVRVVDPATCGECPPGGVGEIWVAGPSVTGGYWRREEESAEAFGARLADGGGPFLRSGDLGSLRDGELFVTGRIKDLIIIRGRNLYPQDIEWTVERSHPCLRPGCGAAFTVEEEGEERLVVVQEVRPGSEVDLGEVRAAIFQAVAEEHEVALGSLVLAQRGAVPKTTSGKIQRRACRKLFLAGEIAALEAWSGGAAPERERVAPRNFIEERLAGAWEEILELAPGSVGVEDSFFALGGDSLRGSQLIARIADETGLELSLEQLFEAPTVAALARRLAAAGAAGAAGAGAEGPRIALARVDRDRPVALSSPQQRLWFLDQLESGNPAYNLAVSARLEGTLEPRALEAALAEVVRRHEALRTVFRVVDGAPVQVIEAPERAVRPLPVVDLSGLAAPEQVAAAVEREGARRPFDLARGPLATAHLVRLDGGDHDLRIVLHHIVSDAWSVAILLREVSDLYGASLRGEASPLGELAFQYRDFVAWQERRLDGGLLERHLEAWKKRLGGSLPVLELPLDRPRPPVQTYQGAHASYLLPAALEGELRALGGAHQASLFMVLLAGFQALLYRRTGQRDLIVGSAVANRERPELEELIGFFINTLPLRTDLSGDPTFTELLGRARGTALEALAGREVPFERLVDEVQPERDLSRTPIVQVMLVLQNAPLAVPPPPGLGLEVREVDNGTARFDLAVSMLGTEEGLTAVFKYRSDLFDATTIDRLAAHFQTLLAAAVAEPDRRLGQLPLLSAAELHQVVGEWNATDAPELDAGARQGACLPGLFEAQADETPDRVAVIYEGEALTYRELDRRANRLAHHLRRRGVGPETLVGVAVERSLELMVGLFAIHKAGGAYVPLDPSYPADRLELMLGDSGAPVLLTQERLQERLRGALPAGGAQALCLDSGWEAVAAESPERPAAAVAPENAAYAIYTSGSTGRPKGVLVAHRAIVNRLEWMQDAYGLTAGERVLQKTPISFDVSVWELFWPNIVGATLVLARPGGHQDSTYMAGLIAAEGVTTLHFVPSMLQVFLEEPRLGECAGLERVIASGEALPRELVDRFFARLDVELHNLYGPTEAAVDVTAWPCRREGDGRGGVPIGRPIANLRIHLLEPGGVPAPVGVQGHLHIGGVGLARGYLGRPALTAERFVPDPFSAPGGRLYATGDLARVRGDGAIEFLGRLDHQVKIRGFRIELGEIEAALNAHSGVRESVVAAHRDRTGGRLVAYLVAAAEAAPRAEELRSLLAESLPDYMVPSAFVVLPSFPLTPSGKVDRKALPAPEEEGRGAGAPWVAPRTPLEARLAAMWSEQLGGVEVGAEDDFFALGGDSIQGALFINRLQRELDAIVYVMALFDYPTVAKLAAHLETSYRGALLAAGWSAESAAPEGGDGSALEAEREEAADLEELSRHLAGRFSPAAATAPAVKNPRAIFILSPFRSGSTLLRVMLEGHPGLFAPPELELLGFETMGERRRVFTGRDSFSREGLLRTVMGLLGCDAEEAAALVGESEERDEPTRELYRRLQEWAGERTLVDKTPRYALDLTTLQRAESWFEKPLYLHLVRHPGATVHSYLEAKLQEVYRFPLPPRRQAELVWRRSHETILQHLGSVSAQRQLRIRFEDLVAEPRRTMEALCAFLGLELDEAMLAPYEGERMTDGIHRAGRMMGDPKFHRHRTIDKAVAERWRSSPEAGRLGEASWRLAERLGYPRPAPAAAVAAAAAGLRPVPRRREEGELPLSFGQQRLWFLDRLERAAGAYSMPAAVRLAGRLDPAALARACAEIEGRHEVLRTVFPSAEGRPRQLIRPARPAVPLPVVDLGELPEEVRGPTVARLIDEEIHGLFDLAAGPLWRLRLLRLGGGEHVLVIHLHHIVCDGWSVAVLTRELVALYEAFRQGAASPLPPLPVQYADFALFQRQHLSGETLEEHLAYWRRQLAGVPPLLELPTDRPRPTLQTHGGTRLPLALPPALVTRLRELGRESGATLFMVLVAAFQVLLYRYSGQDDVAIGTPVANRDRPEIENLIGLFVNTLVLRGRLGGDPAFRAHLDRVGEVCREATRHGELPFEKLVEELGVERSLNHSPLFVVMLALQNAPAPPLALPDLEVQRLDVATRTAKFDLTLDLAEHPEGGLKGSVEYNVDLFDATTVLRLGRQLRVLLEGVVAAPERCVTALPLLGPAERHQLVVAANDSGATFPAGSTLPQLIAATARRKPEAVAVRMEGESLSYGEMAARAGRLARHLVSLGVGPDVRVGLCVERTPTMVVALLAVIEAGGAYVPLDPGYPPERMAYILEDAAAPILLTEASLASGLPPRESGIESRVILVDEDLPEVDAAGPPRRPAVPESLAYLIYTSGSTGKPKGVGVHHRAVLNYLTTMARRPGLTEADVMLALTTVSFDIAVTELYLPLAVGARIELASRETAADASRLAATLDAAGVTCMQATPATFTLLLDGGWEGRADLKVLCGGEALPRPLADRLLPRVGELWNVYGPTETTVWSSLEEMAAGGEQVLIGRPLANTSVHILGPGWEVVPTGVVGELAIGGDGVARGYGGRPGLTADRFIPDRYDGTGGRLYRTGDLARRLPDGRLECLGRRDHQVKLRGFRIELGEIESVLLEHPAVRQSAVRVHGDKAADQRLVAYVVKAPESDLTWSALRGFLTEKLPLPMVPSALVFLDKLPLLASGKVDRKSLPDPGHDRPDLAASYVSPQNEGERVVAKVWREVLGIDRVGIHDNFFDLGGHSLLAAEVHGKLRERFATDISLLELFQHPTVHALAKRLSGGADGGQLAGLKAQVEREKRASSRRRKALARRREVR